MIFNTTYQQKYAVISRSGNEVVLRVLDGILYSSYWKEFVNASVIKVSPMYIRIEQAPPDISLIDQYAAFSPELPIVTLKIDDRIIPITHRIVSNAPNTEVPGLYRIDYRINLTGNLDSVIWQAYVSVQQRPVLRKAAAGWTRDSYITRTLNRLICEPQFMEALHAAGEPLYGFMEANQHPSIKAADLEKYSGIQAWGASGAFASQSNGIFITGRKLPQGAIVIYQKRMLQLQEPVWPDLVGSIPYMDPETHEMVSGSYSVGRVVRSGNASYICIRNANIDTPLGDSDYWRRGFLYKFKVLNGDDTLILPPGILPVGKDGVEHIWAAVDNQGYSFWVDLANCHSMGAYRGYYDRTHFADYGPEDMVSYITEGSIRLYRRKATDIQAPETLRYPPGHHLNPAWDEAYCHFEDDYSPLFSDYSIVPHANAANAILAKTWSVSETMCRAYGHMIGIPDLIVNECGAKWSALLFALLSRTRNTYDGFRLCLHAVGLDIENLRLSDPSIAYYCNMAGTEEKVEDIYRQHENLRSLIKNIDTLVPEGDAIEKEGALRYVTESTEGADPKDIGVSIQQFENGAWVTKYRFENIDPAYVHNNRYFAGDLNVLARLAEDAVKNIGDGHPWVKESAWTDAPSALLAECIAYEIPIYVYLKLKMWLYAENHITMKALTYSGITDGYAGGAKNVLELFPSYIFDSGAHGFIAVDIGVYTLENNEWTEIPPTRLNPAHNSKIYEFNGSRYPLRIMAKDHESYIFVRYWQSTHTFGLLGLKTSESTVNEVPATNPGHFHNVTASDVNDASPLMLANGYVGVTAVYRARETHAGSAYARRWMYVLNDTSVEETWQLSETEPFTDYSEISIAAIQEYPGTLGALKAALSYITAEASGGTRIPFIWDADTLVLQNHMPGAIYLRDSSGVILCSYSLTPGTYTMTEADWIENGDPESPLDSARVSFEYA